MNQNQTRKYEIADGFKWSPNRNRNGNFNRSHENIRLVDAGDLVFSYVDQVIQYIGLVQALQFPVQDPLSSPTRFWGNDWLVPVEWHRLPIIARPKDILEKLRPLLPAAYSPIQSETGNRLQSVYQSAVPEPMAIELLRPLGNWKRAGTRHRASLRSATDFQLHIFAALTQEEERLVSERTKAALARRNVEAKFSDQTEGIWPQGNARPLTNLHLNSGQSWMRMYCVDLTARLQGT